MALSDLILTVVLLSAIQMILGQRQCPKLQKPWNGRFVGKCRRNIGAECISQCREPYILVGSRVRTCKSDGTWSGQTTACELDGCGNCNGGSRSNCPILYNPENGYTDGQCTPGISGQVCQFYCYAGYSLDGQSRLTCLNGRWSSTAPLCRRTSAAICEAIVVDNGQVSCVQQGGLTVCRVSCNEGYIIVGSSVVTCSSSGDWNEVIPICRRSEIEVSNLCPTLVSPDGGRLVGRCTSATTGDTCQLVCLSGYRPTDTRILICQSNGRWSDSLPSCANDGCPSVSVSRGITSAGCSSSRTGDACTITCEAGYTLTGGSGTLLCQSNGQWSGNIPACIAAAVTCPALAAPVSGGSSGTCSPGQVGQSCSFFCNSGYRLVGQSTLLCGSNGRWSGNPPYCSGITCPTVDPPMNGAWSGSCAQARVGTSCSFSCQAGYVLTGQSTIYCQAGGVWSSLVPTCNRVISTCPFLSAPGNGVTSGACSQASIGQTCVFSCQPGYTLNGQSSLYCQEGGVWSSTPPTCTRSTATACASLLAPSFGFMIGTCAPGQVGQTCVFGCDEGYLLRGQRTLTCTSSGQWSSATPRCESSTVEGGNCPVLTPPPNGQFLECDNRSGGQCIVACETGFTRSGSRVRTCLSQGTWSGFAPTCTRTVGYTYTYKVVPLWRLIFG